MVALGAWHTAMFGATGLASARAVPQDAIRVAEPLPSDRVWRRAVKPSFLGLACLSIALVGCDRLKIGDDRICSTPPALLESNRADPATCVHRWAYRLAAGSEATATVADAVVGGCRETIIRQAMQSSSSPDEFEEILAGTRSRFKEEALFYIVQARAGNCPIN
jgi:hypothetical protein